MGPQHNTATSRKNKMQTSAISRYNETSAFRNHSLRGSMQRLFRENVFRKKPQPKPQKPLISKNSNNVFHDQALMQLASVYASLQLGDSQEAISTVYSTGVRIFGQEWFDRAVRDCGTRTYL